MQRKISPVLFFFCMEDDQETRPLPNLPPTPRSLHLAKKNRRTGACTARPHDNWRRGGAALRPLSPLADSTGLRTENTTGTRLLTATSSPKKPLAGPNHGPRPDAQISCPRHWPQRHVALRPRTKAQIRRSWSDASAERAFCSSPAMPQLMPS